MLRPTSDPYGRRPIWRHWLTLLLTGQAASVADGSCRTTARPARAAASVMTTRMIVAAAIAVRRQPPASARGPGRPAHWCSTSRRSRWRLVARNGRRPWPTRMGLERRPGSRQRPAWPMRWSSASWRAGRSTVWWREAGRRRADRTGRDVGAIEGYVGAAAALVSPRWLGSCSRSCRDSFHGGRTRRNGCRR